MKKIESMDGLTASPACAAYLSECERLQICPLPIFDHLKAGADDVYGGGGEKSGSMVMASVLAQQSDYAGNKSSDVDLLSTARTVLPDVPPAPTPGRHRELVLPSYGIGNKAAVALAGFIHHFELELTVLDLRDNLLSEEVSTVK